MAGTNELMDRKTFLEHCKVSDSSERRGRQRGDDWPPHLLIGTKVYYRTASVEDWILRREAQCRASIPDATAGDL